MLIERIDSLALYGEDQNRNGLLDPNENDGDESWPPDNQDGELDRGLAAYLTCWSAARNVTSDGKDRVNINTASAQEIARGAEGITQQQADSIVEHRKKQKFSSIVGLLDVMLVQKVEEKKSDEKDGSGGKKTESSGSATDDSKGSGESSSKSTSGDQDSASESSKKTESKTETTGQKAFDLSTFKSVADLVTASEEEVLKGVINVNTAPVEVLACLPGVDEALAAQIVAQRREVEFESAAGLLDVSGMSIEKFKQICNLVSVRSDVFSVRSFGVLSAPGEAGVSIYCCVAAIIDRTGEEIKLRCWRELR